MAISQDDWAWFAARVRQAVVDINTEHRMSVQVSGLADIVRKAKTAIDTAGVAAVRLNDSAQRVVNTIGQVDDMTRQLDAANADLTAAVGAMSNGGPPLEDTTNSGSSSPLAPVVAPTLSPADGIHVAQVQVEAAHNANAQGGVPLPPGPSEPIAPTVAVTASTIAADQRAAVAAAAALNA
jgi:hypothetical protein